MPMKNPNHPGDIIRDCCAELGVNVTEGAKALGVTRAALSRLINRKAGVSLEMAVRLEKALGSTAGFWLRLAAELRSGTNPVTRREDSRAPPRHHPGAASVIARQPKDAAEWKTPSRSGYRLARTDPRRPGARRFSETR